jgi:hypothetical protein
MSTWPISPDRRRARRAERVLIRGQRRGRASGIRIDEAAGERDAVCVAELDTRDG